MNQVCPKTRVARSLLRGAVVGVLVAMMFGAVATAAPILTVDPAGTNTLIFRDYNGTSDSNLNYSGNTGATTPTQVVADGVSTWTYTNTTAFSDPRMEYRDPAGTWDHAAFPWMRARFKQSQTGENAQYWENQARGGEGPTLGQSTTFVEVSNDASNPNPDGTGYRIDPFSNATAGKAFTLDYVMMDRYETLGLGEWDAVGDTQDWGIGNIADEAVVADGLISGTGDGDLTLNSYVSIDADKYKYVEIRMKTNSSTANESQLFWAAGGSYSEAQSIRFNAGADEFHTYLLDFSNEATWTGTNMRIRLDPIQGSDTFAVDYIRLRTAVVPEPSTFVLAALGLCGLGLLARWRKQ